MADGVEGLHEVEVDRRVDRVPFVHQTGCTPFQKEKVGQAGSIGKGGMLGR